MKARYYLGWFNNMFPGKLSKVLQGDIADRTSLAMISSNPSVREDDGATERSWLDQAGVMFDEYHLINHGVQKEAARNIVRDASAIFLLGGNALKQNEFLTEYELTDSIKKSSAVVLGASAGAINMSAKWLCSREFGYDVDMGSIRNGVGLDGFSVLSHFDLENNMALAQGELSPLSEEIDIYASNKDCAIRVKGDRLDVLGDVFLISHSKIQKLDETL